MELLDRYLQAVKFWLPKKQKQDIIAELSEDLRSQIEDREAELGRNLNECEIATLLKQRGRPILVANRFLPQESLVGPVLFPIYVLVLKMVAAFYMVPWILVWIGIAILRSSHPGHSLIATIGLFWTSFWPVTLFWVGGVTIVFAVLERVQAKSRFLEDWNPRKLPPVRDPNRIARSASVTELIANMAFCIWWACWVGGLWYQTLVHFSGVSITLAPTWRHFLWGFGLVAAANAATSAFNLFRPYWTPTRASLRLAFDGLGSALFCWLMKSNLVVAISVTNVAQEKTAQIAHAINSWSAKMFPFAIAVCVLIAVVDGYRIFRVRTKTAHPLALNTASGVC